MIVLTLVMYSLILITYLLQDTDHYYIPLLAVFCCLVYAVLELAGVSVMEMLGFPPYKLALRGRHVFLTGGSEGIGLEV